MFFSETVHDIALKFGRMVQYDELYVLSDFWTWWTLTSCLGPGFNAGASVSHGHISFILHVLYGWVLNHLTWIKNNFNLVR